MIIIKWEQITHLNFKIAKMTAHGISIHPVVRDEPLSNTSIGQWRIDFLGHYVLSDYPTLCKLELAVF